MDAKDEEKHWREHHEKQTSVKPGHTYEHYAPAYETGYEGFHKYPDKEFEDDRGRSGGRGHKKRKPALPWDHGPDCRTLCLGPTGRCDATPRDVDRGVRYD